MVCFPGRRSLWTIEELVKIIDSKEGFRAVIDLLAAIRESPKRELTGAGAASVIRKKAAEWPLPGYTSVKQCFTGAEKMGLIETETPGSDIKGRLTDNGKLVLVLLEAVKDKTAEKGSGTE